MLVEPSPKKASKKKSGEQNYHVVSNPRGGWDVLREGAKRASNHFATKAEAVARGQELARKHRVELIRHSKAEQVTQHLGYTQQSWLQG